MSALTGLDGGGYRSGMLIRRRLADGKKARCGEGLPAAGVGGAWLVAMVAGGCSSPFDAKATDALKASVIESAKRETAPLLREGGSGPQPIAAPALLTRAPGEVSLPAERMAELESMAGPGAKRPEQPDVGQDLLGGVSEVFPVTLQQVIASSVRNNLDVEVARIEPGIASAQLAVAESAFDWTFFTNFNHENLDRPQPGQVLAPGLTTSRAQQRQNVGYETGVRKPLTSGGRLSVSQGQTYTDDDSPGVDLLPEPYNAAQATVRLEQPLLRNFGSDVATAEIRLNRNAERASVLDLEAAMLGTVTNAERAYWELVRSRRSLEIVQRLFDRGVQTRDVLRGRVAFDAKPAEIADAVATVERRRAQVIRAQNSLRQASDRLKALVNDPRLTVGSEALVSPVDEPPDAPVTFSLLDSISTALRRRPEVQRAVLGIDDATIRQKVADNARLPQLDLALQAQFAGLDSSTREAYDQLNEGKFVDYLVAASFEQPIGNRGPEAGFRRSQLERLRSVGEYRRAVQAVVLDVKTALRNVRTNYQLIEQTRASRLAATENLRTLEVLERTTQSLTPDFLDLKFRRQENLAQAELDEVSALTDYSIALADLAAAEGVALTRNRVEFVVPEGK